jgi:hypothetical protein
VEDAAADTVILDLAGMESLFGSLPEIAMQSLARAAELGLDGNVAVASNPDAAVLAARGFSGVTVIPRERKRVSGISASGSFVCQSFIFRIRVRVKRGRRKKIRKKKSAGLLATLDRWGIRNLRCSGGAAGNCAERASGPGRPAPAATGAGRGFAHAGSGGSAGGI